MLMRWRFLYASKLPHRHVIRRPPNLTRKAMSDSRLGVVRTFRPPAFNASYPSWIIPPFVVRGFTNFTKPSNGGNTPPNNEPPLPEMWIEALENTANAPWLFYLPRDDVDKLKRTFILIFQIILYLGRPQELEKAHPYLAAFATALVPPDSEIGRARRAVANITRAVVNDLSSVPENSPVRKDHAEIFDMLGALRPLCGVYLENVRVGEDLEVQAWSDFWSRAEPILISLCEALDEKGLGLEQDERKAAGQEESR